MYLFLATGAVSWFILENDFIHIDLVELSGNSRVLFTSSSPSAVTVDTISDDGSGQLFVSPLQSLSVTTRLSPCLVMFQSSVLEFRNNSRAEVVFERSLHIYGQINFTYAPSMRIGSYGGSFVMQPGSKPTHLKFANFVVENSAGYEVKLLQNNATKVMNVSGGKFTVGNNANFYSVSPLTLIADDVVINGRLNAATLTHTGWSSLSVGSRGFLNTEIMDGLFRISNVDINGQVQLSNPNIVIISSSLSLGSRATLALQNTTGYIDCINTYGSLTVTGTLDFYDVQGTDNSAITIQSGGSMKIVKAGGSERKYNVSFIRASTVDISGHFLPGVISAVKGWNSLRVMTGGLMNVEFLDELRTNSIQVWGNLRIENAVSIRGLTGNKTTNISISSRGTMILNSEKTSGTSYIRASLIEVNGTFLPDIVSSPEGWDFLTVGPHGSVTIDLVNELRTDFIKVSGNLQFVKAVSVRGLTEQRTRNIAIHDRGVITLNALKTSEISSIRASAVDIDGRFYAGVVSTAEGWNHLNIGSKGIMTVDFRHQFHVNRIYVSGYLEIAKEVSILGFNSSRTQEVVVDRGGVLKLMSSIYHVTCSKHNVFSVFQVHHLFVKGLLQAGSLSVEDGLDSIVIGDSGDFQFYPIGNFSFDIFNVNGKMTSFGDVVLQGKTNSSIHHVEFGSQAIAVLKRCFSHSQIKANGVTVNGQLSTDLLSVAPYWNELLVTGTFNFLPEESFNITKMTITGTMRTLKPFHLPLVGNVLTVSSSGLLSINFQQSLDNPTSGSYPSTIRMRDAVSISGRLEAGSVNVFTKDLTVSTSGHVTVDWGGYASSQGPGGGSPSSSGGSGGSHGGRGGRGSGTLCHRLPYGSIYVSGSWGSGGGQGYGGNQGGRGGGQIYLKIENNVQLDGTIQTLGQSGMVSGVYLGILVLKT